MLETRQRNIGLYIVGLPTGHVIKLLVSVKNLKHIISLFRTSYKTKILLTETLCNYV